MMKRMMMAEWWEVRWVKPGSDKVTVNSGWPAHGIVPANTFATRSMAFNFKRREKNRYHKVIHVRRFKVLS